MAEEGEENATKIKERKSLLEAEKFLIDWKEDPSKVDKIPLNE